jgi:hypothetical protein
MGSVIQRPAMEAPKDALKLPAGVTLPVDAGAVKGHHEAGGSGSGPVTLWVLWRGSAAHLANSQALGMAVP